MSITIAINQPYTFPYIGYFQLIKSVDKFIPYDYVTFIKNGWINRNRILVNNAPSMFSIPLDHASPYKLIREVGINIDLFPYWRKKFYKTLEMNYKRAPHYEKVIPIIKEVFDEEHHLISELAIHSIKAVCNFLKIYTKIVSSDFNYQEKNLKGEELTINICRYENAHIYINSIGGSKLYSKNNFRTNGIELKFLKSKDIIYQQKGESFFSWLSIIDVLMFNSVEKSIALLDQYELV